MKIVVDENIPNRTIVALAELQHSVVDVKATPNRGDPDDAVWAIAQEERALLISTDKGFADLWDSEHHGILIVRLRQPNGQRIHDRIILAMANVAEADWPGLLLIMRDTVQITRRARLRE